MGTECLKLYLWCLEEARRSSDEVSVTRCVLHALRASGGFFLKREGSTSRTVEDPVQVLTEAWPMPYEWCHELLLERRGGLVSVLPHVGGGMVSVLVDSSDVSQGIVARKARNLIVLARMLWPLLCPQFGWVDFTGWNSPTDQAITRRKLTKIMWATFFGPEYIRKYGREFLLGAPGWKKEELEPEGILYIISPDINHRFRVAKAQEIKEYFAPKATATTYRPFDPESEFFGRSADLRRSRRRFETARSGGDAPTDAP